MSAPRVGKSIQDKFRWVASACSDRDEKVHTVARRCRSCERPRHRVRDNANTTSFQVCPMTQGSGSAHNDAPGERLPLV